MGLKVVWILQYVLEGLERSIISEEEIWRRYEHEKDGRRETLIQEERTRLLFLLEEKWKKDQTVKFIACVH